MTTSEALSQITKLRTARWDKGLKARRHPGDPFMGDPREELLEELIDAMNYLGVLAEQSPMETWRVSTLEHHLLQAAVLVINSEEE